MKKAVSNSAYFVGLDERRLFRLVLLHETLGVSLGEHIEVIARLALLDDVLAINKTLLEHGLDDELVLRGER
jgi:hypothetical protein